MCSDRELIERLGGPTKVAELLGYQKFGGVQRVQNWTTRGIPARVKLEHPEIFLDGGALLASQPESKPAA